MNNALLIQYAYTGPYTQMIGLYYAKHADYCARWGMDYWVHGGPVRHWTNNLTSWARLSLVQAALLQGYEYVIGADTDVYIIDQETDLRQACIKPINMARWSYPTSHLQGGVTFFRQNQENNAYGIVTALLGDAKYYLERFPTLPGWFEQGQMNELAVEPQNAQYFGEVDLRFNWCRQYCPPITNPVIQSWHGLPFEERLVDMQRVINGH